VELDARVFQIGGKTGAVTGTARHGPRRGRLPVAQCSGSRWCR